MFTWKIFNLERRTSDNFVTVAHWQLSKTEEDTEKTIFGVCSFGGDATIAFAQLTENEVLGWVWQQVSRTETEQAMSTVLTNKENPISQYGFPWVKE